MSVSAFSCVFSELLPILPTACEAWCVRGGGSGGGVGGGGCVSAEL